MDVAVLAERHEVVEPARADDELVDELVVVHRGVHDRALVPLIALGALDLADHAGELLLALLVAGDVRGDQAEPVAVLRVREEQHGGGSVKGALLEPLGEVSRREQRQVRGQARTWLRLRAWRDCLGAARLHDGHLDVTFHALYAASVKRAELARHWRRWGACLHRTVRIRAVRGSHWRAGGLFAPG